MAVEKKLTRSSNKILAGVCGGIAEYFDVDPTLIRVIYAVLSVFTTGFPGLLLYLILMLIMPVAPAVHDVEDVMLIMPVAPAAHDVEDVKFEDATKKEDK